MDGRELAGHHSRSTHPADTSGHTIVLEENSLVSHAVDVRCFDEGIDFTNVAKSQVVGVEHHYVHGVCAILRKPAHERANEGKLTE